MVSDLVPTLNIDAIDGVVGSSGVELVVACVYGELSVAPRLVGVCATELGEGDRSGVCAWNPIVDDEGEHDACGCISSDGDSAAPVGRSCITVVSTRSGT